MMALYVFWHVHNRQRGILSKFNRPATYFSSMKDNKRKYQEYKKCYHILEIPETSDSDQIRQAYLNLAKKYHPDHPDGNLQKFQEVDNAFRTLIQKRARERWDVEEDYDIKEYDIKHTAPQHRQYLSNEGVGSGTPFQREKQYRQVRIIKASDNVLQHRLAKATADETSLMHKKPPVEHKIKTQCGFDRLVEDLIQESMSKGEFSNLSGSGKPLKGNSDMNPYVDYVTHKINQVLIDNGFTPGWIMLQKEIRADIEKLRKNLGMERNEYGSAPLQEHELVQWEYTTRKYLNDVIYINKKIDKFNLVVPIMNKQMLQIELKREANAVLANGVAMGMERLKRTDEHNSNAQSDDQQRKNTNLFGLLETYFKP